MAHSFLACLMSILLNVVCSLNAIWFIIEIDTSLSSTSMRAHLSSVSTHHILSMAVWCLMVHWLMMNNLVSHWSSLNHCLGWSLIQEVLKITHVTRVWLLHFVGNGILNVLVIVASSGWSISHIFLGLNVMHWTIRVNSFSLLNERVIHLVLLVEHLLNIWGLVSLNSLSIMKLNFKIMCHLLSMLFPIQSLNSDRVFNIWVPVPVGRRVANCGCLSVVNGLSCVMNVLWRHFLDVYYFLWRSLGIHNFWWWSLSINYLLWSLSVNNLLWWRLSVGYLLWRRLSVGYLLGRWVLCLNDVSWLSIGADTSSLMLFSHLGTRHSKLSRLLKLHLSLKILWNHNSLWLWLCLEHNRWLLAGVIDVLSLILHSRLEHVLEFVMNHADLIVGHTECLSVN